MHSSGEVAPSSNTQSDGLDHLMRDRCNLLNLKKNVFTLFSQKGRQNFLKVMRSIQIFGTWELNGILYDSFACAFEVV